MFYFGVNRSWRKDVVYSAELRSNSFYLLMNQWKKHPTAIKIINQEKLSQYYANGEDAYRVSFQIDIWEYLKNDWKSALKLHLQHSFQYGRINIFRETFHYLQMYSSGLDLTNEKNKSYIITTIKELLLDYYGMFGEKIPAKRFYSFYSKNETTLKKSINTLKSYDYQGERTYVCVGNMLKVSQNFEVYNTKFREQISGYRWLRRKQNRFLKKCKHFCEIEYFDRYGSWHDMPPVPYLTQRQYMYEVKRLVFLKKLLEKRDINEGDKERFLKVFNNVFYLLSFEKAVWCMNNIMDRYDNGINYFHDWNIVIEILIEAREILTEGAIRQILCGSYNQAVTCSKQIATVLQIIHLNNFSREIFQVQQIRRALSKTIRIKKDCTAYIKDLVVIATKEYGKTLRIPLKKIAKVENFLHSMQKYCPSITLFSLYKVFGKRCLLKFVEGSYPCLFSAEEIPSSYRLFCIATKKELQKRTASIKRVYRKLIEKNLLSDLIKEEISSEQFQIVINILRHHNVRLSDSMLSRLNDFRILIEPKGSLEFLTAGDASVFCMSYGSQKAITYAKEKGFGIVNVYYKDRVIANSVIWINDPYQCLVLDNIEVHPNYTKYNYILKEAFYKAACELVQEYQLKFAVKGTKYNDLMLYDSTAKELWFDRIKPRDVENSSFYTDAREVKVIYQMNNNPPQNCGIHFY